MEFIFQISIILLLVLLNGYFVASEFSLVAVRRTRVEELSRKGNRTAKLLKNALNELDTYISATQLGITLASLALGWIGEPAIAHFIEPYFSFLSETAAFLTAHTVAMIVGFSLITFLHIVLGELAPKSFALQRPEIVSLIIITPLILFSKVFSPFIWLLNTAGQLVLKLFGLHEPNKKHSVYSEQEVRMILQQSSENGEIPVKEVEMVYNVFQLGDVPVKRVMVPRRSTLAFSSSTLLKDVIKKIEKHPHSRFPVYKNSIDGITGFIHIKDVYRALLKQGEDVSLSQAKITRKGITITETKKIGALLTEMRKKRIHLAVVKDEKRRTVGVVTLEDIIESVVGEIEDEFDTPQIDA
jgi:putative hemolysin